VIVTNDEYMSLQQVREEFVPRVEYERLTAQKDGAYAERDQCVALIAKMALALGWPVGLGRHDEADESWDRGWLNIIFVELPTGQCSWHVHDGEMHLFENLPKYDKTWDGHSTEEKYSRMAACTADQLRDDAPPNLLKYDWPTRGGAK
jgi:hypothetical protein